MNDVYLARDTRGDRQAALKLIKSGPDAVSQLVLEAERRGAAIQQGLRTLDPRVIEVYDYGDLDGYFFVAMQYVEGRNLAEALKHDGRMSAFRAARDRAGDLRAAREIPCLPAGRRRGRRRWCMATSSLRTFIWA